MARPATKQRPGKRWRNADRQARRHLIIQPALGLLKNRGLEAVTMRNVAKRLGVGTMTLYTYINGQEGLRCEIAGRGFDMLNDFCEAAGTLDQPGNSKRKWRGGTRAYVQFAIDNPNLYDLMFHVHPARGGPAGTILLGGLERFVEKVRRYQDSTGLTPAKAERLARSQTERFCIAMHGLASLAIGARLEAFSGDLDRLIDDLLERVAPR